MSIVDLRPERLVFVDKFNYDLHCYMKKNVAKAGITGFAQASGYRGETDQLWKMEKRLDKDIQYINSLSLWLDIKIIWLTIFKVFKDKNAY